MLCVKRTAHKVFVNVVMAGITFKRFGVLPKKKQCCFLENLEAGYREHGIHIRKGELALRMPDNCFADLCLRSSVSKEHTDKECWSPGRGSGQGYLQTREEEPLQLLERHLSRLREKLDTADFRG